MTEWIGARHLSRRSRRQLMFMLDLEVQVFPNGGSVVTADDGQRGLAGVCLSLPPGGWAMPKTIDGRTTARFFRAYGFRLARVIRMQRAMAERHPSEPHYYYRWIGVRPQFRGQGLGSALMRPTLDRCDKEVSAGVSRGQQRAQRCAISALGLRPPGRASTPGRRT